MPGYHAIAVLLITIAVFYLYTRSWIRMEAVSLLLLLSLLLTFYLFPYTGEDARLSDTEILQAFGHPALVAICSLMILGRGLTMTGAHRAGGARAQPRSGRWNRSIGLLLTLVLAGLASGFVNDTPVLVLMLPMLLGIAHRTGHSAAKTLMPVNFAILGGGMLTSIGTSTNLLVLSIATDLGMPPMGIFDFTPIAAVAFAVALPYLWLVAPRLLPEREPLTAEHLRQFEARVVVDAANPRLSGKSLADIARALGRPVPVTILTRDARDEPIGDEHRAAGRRRPAAARHRARSQRVRRHLPRRPVRPRGRRPLRRRASRSRATSAWPRSSSAPTRIWSGDRCAACASPKCTGSWWSD